MDFILYLLASTLDLTWLDSLSRINNAAGVWRGRTPPRGVRGPAAHATSSGSPTRVVWLLEAGVDLKCAMVFIKV